ncbi:choice-of-anchor I family protein [uncultured Desulfuromonas sp.]|uniref:choice-of-anchor I family protein n=1 Tax=uncultured Desulfuromonas sp. TaxID=181013 RepID=UPI002AABA209|nr:choice-of-anchor I family protein [uncultured Desulfuromonas sp.]
MHILFKRWTTLALLGTTLAVAACSDDSDKTLVSPASMTVVGRFAENQALDEGRSEIVSYHSASHSIMVINADDETVDIIDASTLTSTALTNPLTDSNLTLRQQLDVATDVTTITAGGINSVAVHGNLMAVAVENDDKQANGVIAFYTLDAAGTASFLKTVAAGALPDNVVFSPDGAYALSANEGEPSGDYTNDPQGSVTLVAITNGVPADSGTQITFSDEDCDAHVRLSGPAGTTAAQDLEPEYITISGDSTTAYVSLQENNAIAVITLATATVEKIYGLSAKNHAIEGNGLDASNKDDSINIQTYNHLSGLPMPDTVANFSIDGVNYLLTANEGDSREYFFDADEATCIAAGGLDWDDDDGCLSWTDEARVEDLLLDAAVFSDATVQDEDQLGRLKVITTEGDTDGDGDYDELYSFGTRSFSIWNADSGELIYDSGDDFEQITAEHLGYDGFNNNNTENKGDNRSDDKGPEPEALTVGEVNGHYYAFIGLERTGGIMMYNIDDPTAPKFVEYLLNRDLEVDIEADLESAGDLAPEGMAFVDAADSPTGNALLIVGNEASGTTTVYEVK